MRIGMVCPLRGGRFELLVVTEDGARHTLCPDRPPLTPTPAPTQAGTVLLFDPDRTLTAADVVGR